MTTGRPAIAGIFDVMLALDAWLMAVPKPAQVISLAGTLVVMLCWAVPHVPRQFVDFSTLPLVTNVDQPDAYGSDTIADMYEARVVLNDPRDMYVKEKLPQSPLEASTWSREASAPYPPVMLLAEAALYKAGDATGIGFYGLVLALACVFVVLSVYRFANTRWYLFPALYLNFSYFSERFVHVQDGSYLIVLVVVVSALLLAARGREAAHALVAIAITMKLSPLYYVKNITAMKRTTACLFAAILIAGLVVPFFVWDNYLYIYRFHDTRKGDWLSTIGALAVVVPFAVVLWYVETRRRFDWEDRIGWGLIPFAMFMGLKMNAARHLLIVLLVPDKRGARNISAAIALLPPFLLPSLVRFNSALPVAIALLVVALVYHLTQIGWDTVRDDMRHPRRTMRMMMAAPAARML